MESWIIAFLLFNKLLFKINYHFWLEYNCTVMTLSDQTSSPLTHMATPAWWLISSHPSKLLKYKLPFFLRFPFDTCWRESFNMAEAVVPSHTDLTVISSVMSELRNTFQGSEIDQATLAKLEKLWMKKLKFLDEQEYEQSVVEDSCVKADSLLSTGAFNMFNYTLFLKFFLQSFITIFVIYLL